jgi:exoribonuclease-2
MPAENSLVLYKNRAARVARAGDKLDLEIQGGETAKVRAKDVTLLHPGPLTTLADLRPQQGEVEAAWEILAGSHTTLAELAELVYGAYTPVTAWATWQLMADGLYFRGTVDDVVAAPAEEVEHRRAARAAETAEREAWHAFLERTRTGQYDPADARYLRDVEGLALERSTTSRVLRELGREETPENAHALLLDLGYWQPTFNPYPIRLGLPLDTPNLDVPPLPDEPRRDLTGIPAFAVDDEDTDTPDDAISLEGSRLWVHVADAAALAPAGSPLDQEARNRGSTLHLPEGNVPMFPPAVVTALGLGLNDRSPALSFGLDLDETGQVIGLEIVPTWLHVTRLTYEGADERLQAGEEPWKAIWGAVAAHRARRAAAGAVMIDLPEVKVRVGEEGRVALHPVHSLDSRALVEEAMIMAGEAVAQYAAAHDLPLPFATQEPGDPVEAGVPGAAEGLAGMFALRRTLKHSQYRSAVAPHAGLGLAGYAQATSPLRRYLDLVVHQQLRAHLAGRPTFSAAELVELIGAAEAIIGGVRQADRASVQHWTLVYLLQQGVLQRSPWQGEGVLVDKRGLHGTILVPELAWEARQHLPADLPLNAQLSLSLRDVDLPRLDARFRVL